MLDINYDYNSNGYDADSGITFDYIICNAKYKFRKDRLIIWANDYETISNLAKQCDCYDDFYSEYLELISKDTKCVEQNDGKLTLF